MPPLKAQLLLEESLSAYFPEMVFTDSGITVQLHRNTQQELRGLPCAELTVEPAAKQQILSSRSFGERVTDRGEMAQALSGFMARAAEKLRAEGMCCQRVHLFVRTSPFDCQRRPKTDPLWLISPIEK
nr:hypothetical protein [Aeromonas caviae]